MQTGVPQISEAQAIFLETFLNHRGTIASLAAGMDVPLVDMTDILSSPEVRGRINDTRDYSSCSVFSEPSKLSAAEVLPLPSLISRPLLLLRDLCVKSPP